MVNFVAVRRLTFQIVSFERNRTMPPWLTVFNFLEVLSLPILAALSLGVSKLTVGATAQAARRWFFGVLVAVTLITCRTVITLDPCWLTHTTTLSMLFVGALLVPDRESFEERRSADTARAIF
ncbi:MAG TPA: hypothetical protein DDZ51_17235 [Planctomycetaceae bacterium]|nr:hypothetical protein [Planctomycetaceae bacterium]